MEIEYNFLMKNGTWEIVSLHKKAHVIIKKIGLKLKEDRFTNIPKYQARLVAYM